MHSHKFMIRPLVSKVASTGGSSTHRRSLGMQLAARMEEPESCKSAGIGNPWKPLWNVEPEVASSQGMVHYLGNTFYQ